MMSDEEDYMSNEFLNVKEDICPGLVYSKHVKRKYEIEKKQHESNKRHKTKSHKLLEEESRNSGLSRVLNSNNKGFVMLQKMGYKPGMKLGSQKESIASTGLIEPIRIQLKNDRGGLGREEEVRKKIALREERKSKIKSYKEEETAQLTEAFRERMRNKIFQKYLISDLKKCQQVCQQLDTESSIEEPMRSWFWYSQELSAEDDYNENDEIEPEEQLSFILDYLRSKYLYCLWCGIKYETQEDMSCNCPGTEKNDHDE